MSVKSKEVLETDISFDPFGKYPLSRGEKSLPKEFLSKIEKALKCSDLRAFINLPGGSAWESNPPNEVLARYTGFEVREPHQ